MTLSPIFRSHNAVEALKSRGYLDRLAPSIAAERAYVDTLHGLLADVIDRRYLADHIVRADDIAFLQEHFFLTLFDSVFRALGCPAQRLHTYGLLNLCVKGLVVSGDNLFDNEAKMDLPLALGKGRLFASIMQMLCFDHLVMRILEKHPPGPPEDGAMRYRRDLLNELAFIGTLEGSEEAGVNSILPMDTMIKQVHEVRGGLLFSLAFIAPRVWEPADQQNRWAIARRGIARLGTAFQIVDDLTDFEFDLTRRSHNALAARIAHDGTPAEKAAFEPLWAGQQPAAGVVERSFRESARAVLTRARIEAERGFVDLAELGFWYPPEDADLFVRAIAGDAGDDRIDALTTRGEGKGGR